MVSPETASHLAPAAEPVALDEKPTGASGTRLKVAARPATVGVTWLDLFQPGTSGNLSLEARIRVVADVAGALIQIHDNGGVPRQHRRHGRVTPRHVLVGVDGSASLFNAKEPFSKLVPPQPDLGYLAPELLTQSGPAVRESDVFSLGVLLWEALDNGRLFPHRRAAAISRLIARRALPSPRIEEEWALPLAEVALKALSHDAEARYPDASAFWLALREHLPAPDAARTALSRLVQQALKLELTAEIRDAPPYVSPVLLGPRGSLRPSFADPTHREASERYSLRPEPSSRRPTAPPQSLTAPAEDPAWAISEPPAPLAVARPESAYPFELRTSRPPLARHPLSGPVSLTPDAQWSRPLTPVPPSSERPRDSAVSTLHVQLPREIVDNALPLYISSQPAPKPFPWGAVTFAALMFFGVGAAVAFGAVTALRGPPAPAPVPAPLTSAATAPAPAPPPSATPPVPSSAPASSEPEKTPAEPTNAAPAAAPGETRQAKPPASSPRRSKARSQKARSAATESSGDKSQGAAVAEGGASAEADSLPFVDQPY